MENTWTQQKLCTQKKINVYVTQLFVFHINGNFSEFPFFFPVRECPFQSSTYEKETNPSFEVETYPLLLYLQVRVKYLNRFPCARRKVKVYYEGVSMKQYLNIMCKKPTIFLPTGTNIFRVIRNNVECFINPSSIERVFSVNYTPVT